MEWTYLKSSHIQTNVVTGRSKYYLQVSKTRRAVRLNVTTVDTDYFSKINNNNLRNHNTKELE